MTEVNTAAGYHSYQNMVLKVNDALSDLMDLCEKIHMDEQLKELQSIQEKLSNHTFSVGIMGEFKRGKSTVINSLLEKEIMPADILPCSATMNRVTYDLQPHVQLLMRDGTTKDIPVEELASYVTKLTAENESRAAEVDEAIVYYPCRFCKNGVDIVDTPGLNDDDRMNKISEEVIPKLDAVIMVLTPDNPFSISEAEFVRNKLMASDLSRLIFVVNKIDTIRRAADRVRVVEGIREKIHKSVMQKMADIYGEGSPEFEDAVRKVGTIKVFPFSALDALDGKMTGDQKLIEQSGTLEFEAALTKMLTEDRGALELSGPLNAIARISLQITKTISLRKQALGISAKEFEESQKQALAEIEKIRNSKADEKKRLRLSELDTRTQLKQMISDFYPTLTEALNAKLDEAVEGIDLQTLSTKEGLQAAAEQLQRVILKESENQLALISEKVQDRLEVAIGRELVETSRFISSASDKLDEFNAKLFRRAGFDGFDLIATGVEAFVGSSFMGLGGIVAGFKNAGVKGALVGGGTSFGTTMLVATLLVSMNILGPAALIISALAGTLAGKFSTMLLFRKDISKKKLDEIRDALRQSIDTLVSEMRTNNELEKWSDDMTAKRFQEVINALEDEIERLLRSSEGSIDQIKHDMTENDVQRRQLEKNYDGILLSLKKMAEEDIAPITARVHEVLQNM